MSSEAAEAHEHRRQAADLPDGDVVGIVLRHHADITDAMEQIKDPGGESRVRGWEALVKFLKAHETAEQMVIRPRIENGASAGEAQARNAEEQAADQAIMELDRLGPDSPEFATAFAQFADTVHEHAEHEEHDELPVLMQLTAEDRVELGSKFLAAFNAVA